MGPPEDPELICNLLFQRGLDASSDLMLSLTELLTNRCYILHSHLSVCATIVTLLDRRKLRPRAGEFTCPKSHSQGVQAQAHLPWGSCLLLTTVPLCLPRALTTVRPWGYLCCAAAALQMGKLRPGEGKELAQGIEIWKCSLPTHCSHELQGLCIRRDLGGRLGSAFTTRGLAPA